MDAATYIATYPESAGTAPELLDDAAFRDALYRALHPTPPRELLGLVRELFHYEARYRADDDNDGEYFENLYWVALFLYQIGDLSDVLPMWRAKHIDMDTGGGFDIQFLVGGGVAETIEFVQAIGTLEGDAAAEYLAACRDAKDFDALDEWLRFRIAYFG